MTNVNNNPITEDVLKNVFNIIEIKMPNFLTDEIKASFKDILVRMADPKDKYDADVVHLEIESDVRKCKGVWDFVFTYTNEGNIVIDGFVTGIHSIHKKCKFKSLAVAKIVETPGEKHFVGKYIRSMYDKGELTISEFDKLMWKFSLFPESVRNRIDGASYKPESNKLELSIATTVKISITSKGFTSIPVVIYKPERIEFKIAQKYVDQMDIILKHHW